MMQQVSPRQLKILQAIADLSGGTTRPVKYEDIVVKAFELHPRDFQLRGYPQFPDSSDIHKPLYNALREKGFVRKVENKTFALTQAGLDIAQGGSGLKRLAAKRLSRAQQADLHRLVVSDALKLFLEGQQDKIVDTDFYRYLGTTVRTPSMEFAARLRQVEEMVGLVTAEDVSFEPSKLIQLHEFLTTRFSSLIDYYSKES